MIMAEVRDIVDFAYEEELQDTYSSLVDSIESDKFDIISVKCYFKHIPIKDIHLGWSDNVYAIAEQCHRTLYEYCKKKHYLESDITYDDYLKGALFSE